VEHEQLQEKRFFDKAMGANGDPDKVAMDKSGTNEALIDSINEGPAMPILMRQVKYLNNIVEQDHRAIKPVTRPILNFKSYRSDGSVLASMVNRHEFTRHSRAAGNTAFHIRPATCHC
jgi:putative transposase